MIRGRMSVVSMSRAVLVGSMLALLAPAWEARAADHPPEVLRFLERVNPPVVLAAPGTERVRVLADLAYGDVPTQRCDVYLPPRAGGAAAPVVLVLHGGMGPEFPVRPKDWGLYRSWGRLLAARGMVTVIPNHRAGYPEPALDHAEEDLKRVLEFTRAHAREWKADPGRLAIAAYSGGGPLLAVPMRERPEGLRALVGIYPILDPAPLPHMREAYDAETLARYSPRAQLERARGDIAPMLVLRAGADAIPDLLPGLDGFVAKALELDAPVEVVNVRAAPHGFDNDPKVAGARGAVAAMVTFLRRQLGLE